MKMHLPVQDMPKLESPFVRQQHGRRFLVTPEVAPGYEWVFGDPNVIATEKLNGTNVSVVLALWHVKAVYNRTNRIDPWESGSPAVAAVRNAWRRKRIPQVEFGQFFGEAVGPRIQGNPYGLTDCEWVPFATYARTKLRYRSWGKYPKDFETISRWLREDIHSLFHSQRHSGDKVFPEGIVFHHLPCDGRMAKLRRDMFGWYDDVDAKRQGAAVE